MRNVTRLPKPNSLACNAVTWTQELLAELAKGDLTDPKRINSLSGRYDKPDVRDALKKMYRGLCCYCESRIRAIAGPQIEHRKPKKHFPENTFSWNNLHLVCPKCNRSKWDRWNAAHPILDAVIDEPIDEHFEYKRWYWVAKTPNGSTTYCHADLGREELSEARSEIFNKTYDLIESARKNPAQLGFVRTELNKLSNGQYGSLVKHMVSILEI